MRVGNARVQVWDKDLSFKTMYDTVGNPWTVCVSPGPHQYLYVSNSVPDNGDSRTAANTGEEPRGPRQTVEAGIDYVKASIHAWERIAHEAALGAVGAARTQTVRRR